MILLSPALPHLGETLWAALGHPPFVYNAPWPKADSGLLKEESFKLAVQVNGKMRGTIEVSPYLNEEEIKQLVLDLPLVNAQVQDKPLKKFIFIPGKVANVVL